MKTTYLGSSQTVIIQSADNVEVTIHEYPLAKVVEVTARRWATLKRLKAALVNYVPSDEHLRHAADRLARWAPVCSRTLNAAVILVAIYLLVEIGRAFLPGGAAERILGGAR